MKRFAAILLMISPVLCAAQSATVTGHISDPSTTSVTSRTFVRATLANTSGQQCKILGTALITPYTHDFQPNGTGDVSFSIYENSAITCGVDTGKTRWVFNIWRDGKPTYDCSLQVNSNTNLNSAICLNVNPTPVTVQPTDAVYCRLDGVNCGFTGPITFGSTLTATNGGTLGGTFTGNPNFSGNISSAGTISATGTVTGSNIPAGTINTGTGTTNFIPRYTNGATGAIGNSSLSDNGVVNTSEDVTINTSANQSGANLQVRGLAGNLGNQIEFGHTNTAGYGSNIGSEFTTGNPFLCFMCEAGTTNNTYRTRGNTATILRGTTGGSLQIGTVSSNNADNQAFINTLSLSNAGQLQLFNTSGAQPFSIQNNSGGGLNLTNNAGNQWQFFSGGGMAFPQGQGFSLLGATSGQVTFTVPAVVGGAFTLSFPGINDTVVTRSSTDTLNNHRITPRIVTLSTSTTFTPDGDNSDLTQMNMTGTAGTLTIAAPTGTPTEGQKLILRIQTTNAQTYSFNAIYRFSTGVVAPTTTATTKTDYIGCIWNAGASKWDVVAVDQGH